MINAREVRKRYINEEYTQNQWLSFVNYVEKEICNAAAMGMRSVVISIYDQWLRNKIIKYLIENEYRAFENKYHEAHGYTHCDSIVIEW